MPHDHLPDSLRPGTRAIHAGQRPDPVTGAVMPPISLSSTYAQSSPGVHQGYEYSRTHNPTRFALERMVAGLEGTGLSEEEDRTQGGFAFVSGMSAIATTLDLLDTGAHVVAMDDLYGGSGRLFRRVRARSAGLKFDFADLSNLEAFQRALRPDTALVWVETPTNPMLKIAPLKRIAELTRAKAPTAILACDNTFASPINQRPLALGFDLVVHSSTKYLNGHSDSVGGVLATNDISLAERLRFLQNSLGASMSPFDAYLTLRGIKTLDVRMQRHNQSGLRIAQHLSRHPKIERVLYPGLESHPQSALAADQMSGFTGMVTIILNGALPEARRFLERLRLFALAESLGGVESLVDHPGIMTHASVPPEIRAQLGITDSLIRLSVGIEDCEDLIADVDQALG